ncbi:MAG TPA: DUF3306 domain-containing protein, partial [Gammaproteobacteria bacterium]|nr:DUF3306 domain-containing protein [Gammaproteobacteria bacterium]
MKRESVEISGTQSEAGENPVERWSRLKRQSSGEASDAAPQPLQAGEQPAPVEQLTDADMPDIESLTPDSDYTGFLSPQVSESLRRLALRRLFQGAQFNVRDGLDDYDQDFTGFAKLGGVVTADMRHLLAQEQHRPGERETERGQKPMNHSQRDPRAEALAAMERVSLTPTGMVAYSSGGNLVIVGGKEAVAAAKRLPAALTARVLLVSGDTAGEDVGMRVDRDTLRLEGYLGAFRLVFRDAGRPVELEADMVLDLGPQPLISAALPPPGYIYCPPDETAVNTSLT